MNKKTNDEVLNDLDAERGRFTDSNESVMQSIIDELVARGIYPSKSTKAMEKYGYDILKMVTSYGVNWYFYDEPLECEHCKANLRDEENGPPFKREIAIYDILEDGTVDCICPDCYRSLNNGKQYDKEEWTKVNNTPPLEPLEE